MQPLTLYSVNVASLGVLTIFSDDKKKIWIKLRDLISLSLLRYSTGRFVNYYNQSFTFVHLKDLFHNTDQYPFRKYHQSRETFFVSLNDARIIIKRFRPDINLEYCTATMTPYNE